MPLLAIDRLTVSAQSDRLLGPISLALEPGERRALVGPSGSGKSLTASAALGLLPPALTVTGSVRMGDQEVGGAPLAQRPPSPRAAWVPQDPTTALNPQVTIGAHLAMALDGSLAPADEIEGASADLLEQLGFDDPRQVLTRRPFQLSGGQRQRVCLGLALARHPDLLVADEPTTALDAATQHQILGLLDRMLPEQAALLFITHDISAARAVGARPLLIDGGRIVADPGTTAPAADAAPGPSCSGEGTSTPPRAPSPAGTGLRVRAVTVTHPTRGSRTTPFQALQEVDLDVLPGERVGLVGASGSGKTTLLRVLLGLQTPTSGGAALDGRPIPGRRGASRRALHRAVQLVPQDARGSLNPRATARGQVLEPLRFLDPARRVPRAQARRTAEALLRQVGLPRERWSARPAELSGGQCQRVAVARALAARPRFLLADEPLSGLDAHLRASVEQLLEDSLTLSGRHAPDGRPCGLVLVSHDLGSVLRLTDRLVVLEAGRVVEDCATRDVLSTAHTPALERLIEARGGEHA